MSMSMSDMIMATLVMHINIMKTAGKSFIRYLPNKCLDVNVNVTYDNGHTCYASYRYSGQLGRSDARGLLLVIMLPVTCTSFILFY